VNTIFFGIYAINKIKAMTDLCFRCANNRHIQKLNRKCNCAHEKEGLGFNGKFCHFFKLDKKIFFIPENSKK
jgi:hypothetical protein